MAPMKEVGIRDETHCRVEPGYKEMDLFRKMTLEVVRPPKRHLKESYGAYET